jgi:hypothetical protein
MFRPAALIGNRDSNIELHRQPTATMPIGCRGGRDKLKKKKATSANESHALCLGLVLTLFA